MSNMPQQEQTVIYRPTPFNFVDMQEKADAYLEAVRAEAARIADEARAELTRLRNASNAELEQKRLELSTWEQKLTERERKLEEESARVGLLREEIENGKYEEAEKKGRTEGYDAGHAEGYAAGEKKALSDYDERLKQEADALTQERVSTLMPALEKVIANLVSAENMFVSRWEEGTLQVAAAIAQQAINRELPQMMDVPLKLLREALELAVGSVRLKIRMNPQDIESLGQEIDTVISQISPVAETEIIADMRVSQGGCYLETSQGTIDQRIESRLERIVSELEQ